MRGDEPLSEAGMALLGSRLQKASKKLEAARNGDAEGVHDLRVAIRKIRAAISVLREAVLAPDALRKEDQKLSRLFSALGDVRDHDVICARVTEMARRQSVKGKALDVLLEELDERGKGASRRLRSLMKGETPEDLLDRIAQSAAQALEGVQPKRDDHRLLVRHHAASVLLRRFETVLAYEVVLPASIEVLHRLRVAIKKLRYAIDFFAEPLGGHEQALDGPLQKAQDELGNLHDHHVARQLVSEVERARGTRRGLEQIRAADDADAESMLLAFEHSWKEIGGGAFAAALLSALSALLGPAGARTATLALRRAESHA